MKFKGPVFPSFLNQQTSPPKMQWKAHCGKRAQLRNLRHACRPILESRDLEVQEQVRRVIEATKGEPMPEFGKLHLIYAAIDACDQTGELWKVCMKYLMDKFDYAAEDAASSGPNEVRGEDAAYAV